MPASEHQVAANEVMADLWFSQLRGPRLALCALAYLDSKVADQDWHAISVHQRMSLVRAMHALADITIDCCVALEAAHLAIENQRASN